MDTLYDYKQFGILYVDDEEKSLKYFTRAFQNIFQTYVATNAKDGLALFEQRKDDIAVVMTDQRMPGEKGTWLLEQVRHLRPKTIRILATAFSDLDAAIEAVNEGAIYKYVTKPWDVPELDATLRRGLEFFMVQRERDMLLREKLTVLHNMMITDRVISLGIVAAGLERHVNNSLAAVRTFLDLAPAELRGQRFDMEQLRNPTFWSDFYKQVRTQVERITSLLRDLSPVSGAADSAGFEERDIKELVLQAIDATKEDVVSHGIQVIQEIPAGLPALNVHPGKFQRMFELLFQDLAPHLPQGAEIQVSAETVTRSEGITELCVRVRDTGPGLPEGALRALFDPFFLRADDSKEFGIHLMACYFIAYHHGGTIEVGHGDPGDGTSFSLYFPLSQDPNPIQEDEQSFLTKVMLNESLWERILAGD